VHTVCNSDDRTYSGSRSRRTLFIPRSRRAFPLSSLGILAWVRVSFGDNAPGSERNSLGMQFPPLRGEMPYFAVCCSIWVMRFAMSASIGCSSSLIVRGSHSAICSGVHSSPLGANIDRISRG
jgi:hypothetical protein